MPAPQCWFAASTEEFPPSQMLEQCARRRGAGFDGLGSPITSRPGSRTVRPDPGLDLTSARSGRSDSLPMATGVTPVIHHYHPGVIAQAFVSLDEMYPGRVASGSAPARR